MDNQKIQKFNVIGISIRTTNENGQSSQDIPALWGRWMSEGLLQKIPNKVDDTLYCIYTDYEKDHTKPYTTILGCRVSDLNTIPSGMVGRTFEEGNYLRYLAKGNILQGMVFEAWTAIWNSDVQRAFLADFEVYGDTAKDPEHAEVPIFISVK